MTDRQEPELPFFTGKDARDLDELPEDVRDELEFVLARTSKAARGSMASEPTRVRVSNWRVIESMRRVCRYSMRA